ncbi:related to hard surface induced protein 3 [Phialocephala subalpina]|uniref:Related to hard surface induced protein 3 n=1 Tax=Phialocephala subalpina TaxID=576137 RepID=A0A1L7XRI0_9HELO|nr:related to hard surface induced protein 3 [Phialocephala subalpina]
MSASRQENVKWVDGLRGIASLLVVLTHLTRAFDDDLFKPTSAEGASPRLLQLPFLRVLVQGRIGVPIFSLVTGYVCALKPIRIYANGQQEKALVSITKSAFRRIPRLVLPASIATIIIWVICEFGGFSVTKHVASWWLIYTTPNRQSIVPSFLELCTNLITTWTREWNVYEPNQWTLLPLLKGAFLVYVMLFATAYMKPKYRMMVEMALFVYYYIANDPEFGIHFFFGAFLCDLSQLPAYTDWIATRKWPGHILSPICILIGLLFASYPETKAEWMPWSNAMLSLSKYIFPPSHPDTPRFYTGLGLTFLALGLHFSDHAKQVLSYKYLLWCGKNSFAVYLLHGTFLRTVLVWMLYGFVAPKDILNEDGSVHEAPHLELGSRWWFYLAVGMWFGVMYWAANLWTTYVDAWCGRFTASLEKRTFHQEEEKSQPLLPQ